MTSKLPIATEGPCKGHPCDNCAICQRGRCCRNDDPHYRLPELGEWDGSIYGEIGVLADDGEKIECHCCGKWFSNLANHVWKTHNLTKDEYKAIFGLSRKTPLAGPALRHTFSKNILARPWDVEHIRVLGSKYRKPWTPEQRSAIASQPKRPEAKRRHADAARQSFANGRLQPWTKLTREQVVEIRRNGPLTTQQSKEVASDLGVTWKHVWDLSRGKYWKPQDENAA